MMDLSGVSSAPAPSQQQAAAQQAQVSQPAAQQHPLTTGAGPIPGLQLPGRNYISSLSKSNQDGTSFSIQDDQDFPALGNKKLPRSEIKPLSDNTPTSLQPSVDKDSAGRFEKDFIIELLMFYFREYIDGDLRAQFEQQLSSGKGNYRATLTNSIFQCTIADL